MKRNPSTQHRKGHFSTGGPLILTQSEQSREQISKSARRHNAVKRMKAAPVPVLGWRKAV